MAKLLPHLYNNRLMDPNSRAIIVIGTSDWYNWLEQHSSFAFIDQQIRLTVRKEPNRSGGRYWKAYRRIDGRLYNVYLGKSSDMTPERLKERIIRLYEDHLDLARKAS